MNKKDKFKKYIAEFIGTFFLVFIGTGAIIINNISNNAIGHLGVSFTFGFVVVVLIYATGHISGAHFNPAVTIAFSIIGKFDKKQIIPYLFSQILGGIMASVLLKSIFSNICNMGCTLPTLSIASNTIIISFIIEIIFTFFIMFIIMSVATDSRAEGSFAGLAIGLAVFIGATVAGPISGGSFNPARSIAPAIVSGNLNHLWIYIVAPVIGATLASLCYSYVGSHSKIIEKIELKEV